MAAGTSEQDVMPMAASDPERCRENARNAVTARWARTAPQRAAKELTDWAKRSAAALEPLAPHEVAAVAHLAAAIDARLAGSDHAGA
jgi:hypothetical protein